VTGIKERIADWWGSFSIIRVLSIALVLASLLAFLGITLGLWGLYFSNIPSNVPQQDLYWMRFIGVVFIIGSLVSILFAWKLIPDEWAIQREAVYAASLVLGVGVGIITFETFDPSVGMVVTANVLLNSVMFIFGSTLMLIFFESTRKRNLENGDG
jgi:hypothetical protein